MEKNIVELAVWAFAHSGQLVLASNTVSKLEDTDDKDKLFLKLSKYYRQQINPRKLINEAGRADAFSYLDAALEAINRINKYEVRNAAKKEIINDLLYYLKKPQAPIDKLIEYIHGLAKGMTVRTYPEEPDRLVKKIIKVYLGVPAIQGEKMTAIVCLYSLEKIFQEMKNLIPVFIARGDYKALRAIYEYIGKLGVAIVKQGEELVQSCLKNNRIDDAKAAIFFIYDKNKRLEYCKLLGANFDLLEEIRYDIK